MQIEMSKSWLTAMQNYERELVSIVERYGDARIVICGRAVIRPSELLKCRPAS